MISMRCMVRISLVLGAAFIGAFAGVAAFADEATLRAKEEAAIKAALARVAPSVVRIETVGGLERVGRVLIGTGPTTGLVVSDDGYVVSSAFNFVQKPDSILVTLEDGSRHAARLVATDNSRMLVLLKVDVDQPLTVPEAAPKQELRPGQWALAVGRTFEPERPNVSVGIISALDRIWGKAVQTDAKVSPNNYGGPLVDIRGRVLGVLVPMSPTGTGEVAGVEWYDSGIGFAIPLEDVLHVLPKLVDGADLDSGLLGVSLTGVDLYSNPAVIAMARAKGPAYQAGFRAGDKIVEVDGKPVTRAAELKHALGPKYAGDTVRVVAERGDARVDRRVELVDQIEPYEAPFLGILPRRFASDAETPGLIVRYVYAGSPAAAAGIQPGDRIQSLASTEVADVDAAREVLLPLAPGETVKLEIRRGEQTLLLEAELARLPEALPGELPPARDSTPPAEGDMPPVGVVDVKVPEIANECFAYVPDGYDPRVAHGVVVWLHAPGGFKREELLARWQTHCDAHDFILLAPQSTDGAVWRPTDVRMVRRLLDKVCDDYNTDPSRIVVYGHQGGGALAYVFGFSQQDVVRAIAAVDTALPRMVRPPETDPLKPQAIFSTVATKTETSEAVSRGIEQLRTLKYPVTVLDVGEQARSLTPDEIAQLVRWFDTLDRL